MTFHQQRGTEDENNRVAAYESLLDLFTLVSFILIFAAFIYVARSSAVVKDWASISAQDAVSGSGVPQTLPKDVLLLIVYQENSIDRLTLVDGTTGVTTTLVVTVNSIDGVLNSYSSTFASVNKINIGIYEPKQKVNPGIVLAIQRWLSNHGYTKYDFYFAGVS